ncbi:hypothetical protein MAPG_07111 [Magnaporthiopsis poae ATCC 64411]|uniref:Nephrocystin 3-like N-terminal domain-containing protein n=1 Tax=Magnaporthiopsis poae (strain ATCC 64411 / 73-15) TaxID=644358 RepID=A0A0C4E3U0_MAGP6|nr:hypothetical protein MAPG_07111 [Magnaporthiopsis poae ATCC 64411]
MASGGLPVDAADPTTASDISSNPAYTLDTVYTASLMFTSGEGPLVCEFRNLLGCAWSFGTHEIEGWVAHVASHLGGRFPGKSLCWFCDNAFFDGGETASTLTSNTKNDKRRLQFERRLRHVADHVVLDGYTYTHMRPDYHVIRHLYDHDIIYNAIFEQCMQYTELPESLRRTRLAGADKPGVSLPRVRASHPPPAADKPGASLPRVNASRSPPGADIILGSGDKNGAAIAAVTSNCESNFSRCIRHLESTGEEETATELRRLEAKFLDWKAYLGVFARGSASLDHLLDRQAQQRDLVLLALDMLDMSLAQMTTDPDDSESGESSDGETDRRAVELGGVRKSINELSRLAIHIRLSPTSSLDARVQAFGAKKAAEIAPFKALAMLAVNRLYPDSTDSIRRLLGEAMTDRYTRLLYWKYHDRKLRLDRRREDHITARHVFPQGRQRPPVPPAAPHQSRSPTKSEISNPAKPEESQMSFGTGLLSDTVPSNPASRVVIPPREGDIPIQRRAGASTVLGSKAKFPEPPKLKDGETSLPCPLCRKIFPEASFKDVVWWRQHVNDDLIPFICLVDACSESCKYASRAEWKAHTTHHHDNLWSRSRMPRTRDHMPTKRGDTSGSGDIPSPGNPTDDCPLCCLPLTQPGNSPNQRATAQKPLNQPGQEPSASDPGTKKAKKSVRFDAAASDPTPASENLDQIPADVAPFSTPRTSKDSLLDHIAEHMQFLALLTVRLAVKRVTIKSDDRSFSSAQEASSDGSPRNRSTLDTDIEFSSGDSRGESAEDSGDVPMPNMSPEDAGPRDHSGGEETPIHFTTAGAGKKRDGVFEANTYTSGTSRPADLVRSLCTDDIHEYLEKFHPTQGTCRWIEGNAAFQNWLDGRKRKLWIYGKLGAGKTYLAAHIIRHMRSEAEKSIQVANCFLNERLAERNSFDAILRSTVHQLITNNPSLCGDASLSLLEKTYNQQGARRADGTTANWLRKDLISLWRDILIRSTIKGNGLVIIIDGFDNIPTWDQERFLGCFEKIEKDRSRPVFRILILSRWCLSLADPARGFVGYQIEEQDTIQDIRRTTEIELSRFAGVAGYSEDFQKVLCDKLTQEAEGIYLWAAILISEVRIRLPGENELQRLLDGLPKAVAELFDSLFGKILSRRGNAAHKVRMILLWVVFGQESLTLDELNIVYALAGLCEQGGRPINNERLTLNMVLQEVFKAHLARLCGQLLSFSPNGHVTPIHRSLKKYLITAPWTFEDELRGSLPNHEAFYVSTQDAHAKLANMCAAYLAMPQFESAGEPFTATDDGRARWEVKVRTRIDQYKLLKYAALYWLKHFRYAGTPRPSRYDVLCDAETGFATSWCEVWWFFRKWPGLDFPKDSVQPIYEIEYCYR